MYYKLVAICVAIVLRMLLDIILKLSFTWKECDKHHSFACHHEGEWST
jgi:hypothetical protein